MGLDMYLEVEMPAPVGSPLAKLLDEHLTTEERGQIVDEEWGRYTYIAGWAFSGTEPHPLYAPLIAMLRFTPHPGSPHFTVTADDEGGYMVDCPMIYWRKANAIHRWFVEKCGGGIDDQDRFPVHPEALMDLLERCEKVAADHDLGPELLPSMSGFFFGSTEYDEWYFADVEETAKAIKSQVTEAPLGAKLWYVASW